MRAFDTLIVGNGVLSMFLAAELIRRGRTGIAVAGDPARESGASQAAGAMLGCFGEVTKETLRSAPAKEKFEFGLAARKRWPAKLKELSDLAGAASETLNIVSDTYVVLNARGAALDTENFDAMLAALETYGEPWEEADPRDIAGFNPRPDSRALMAVRLPEEGAVDARGALRLLERFLRESAVSELPTVSGLIIGDGAVVGARLSNGEEIRAGVTVVASGAKSGDLLTEAGVSGSVMPLFAGLGFSLAARRMRGTQFASVVRTPNRAFACGLHLVPLGDGVEYLGATNMVVGSATSHAVLGDVHFLTDCAMRQLDEEIYHHQILQWRIGNRPVSLDGFPLIGWTSTPQMYMVTGTYRDGFHTAPLIAEHVADQLAGSEGCLGNTFSATRRPIATRTVEESIDDFVQHRLAAWFEAGAQTPPNTSTDSLSQILRDQAATFYDRLGLQYGLSPDVLMYILGSLRTPHAASVIDYLGTQGT